MSFELQLYDFSVLNVEDTKVNVQDGKQNLLLGNTINVSSHV